jgi:hypothetical protein
MSNIRIIQNQNIQLSTFYQIVPLIINLIKKTGRLILFKEINSF